MKISFIATVFNEESSINVFLDSILNQSKLPDEVVVVDGGSTDGTEARTESYGPKFKKKKIEFGFIIKPGNRSVGRNEAIKNSKGNIIVCSDAGCVLDKDWIKNIVEPFKSANVDVVAGYYKGTATTIFEKCLIPYVLVMPDKVKENNFLPATRSIAFTKSIWQKAGGFDEKFSYNEDYVFAKKLKKMGAKMVFCKKALVYWSPRKNLKQAFDMFYHFAKGDTQAKILRPKVIIIFARYILGFALIVLYVHTNQNYLLLGILVLLFLYIVWSILKNYQYVKHPLVFFWLPVLQFTADSAVLLGTITGALNIL